MTTQEPADGPADPPPAARMCVWRIFGVSHDWADRPAAERSRTFTVEAGPKNGDRTTVVIGDIAAYILTALTDWRAARLLALDAALGGGNFGLLSPPERDALIAERRAAVNLDDVTGPFPLWVTFEVSRPVPSGVDYARDTDRLLEDLGAFGAAADEYLTSAMARLLGPLGDQLQGERLLFAEPRAYLLSEGRPAVTVPITTGHAAMAQTSSVGWGALPFGAIDAALKGLPNGTPTDAYRKAAGLLWSALEHEGDPLRRFLFAFVGLEVLARQVGGKLRDRVVGELATELGGIPIRDLIVPDRSDGELPYRGIQFQFACLAISVSRPTAAQDMETFRELAKARNSLVHDKSV